MLGLDLILYSRLDHQHHRVEVVVEFSQAGVIEFLVVVLQLSRVGVEVPPRLEVDEEPTAMLSPGDLRRDLRWCYYRYHPSMPSTCVCVV